MSEDEKKLAAEREEMRAKLIARREREEMREASVLPDVSFTATLGEAITYGFTVQPDLYESWGQAMGCGDTWAPDAPKAEDESFAGIDRPSEHTYSNPGPPPDVISLETLRRRIEELDAEFIARVRERLAAACNVPLDVLFPESFRLDGAIQHQEIKGKVIVGGENESEPQDTTGAVRSWYGSDDALAARYES